MIRNKLRKYGITDERYTQERLSGNRWCCISRHFMPSSEMLKGSSVCKPCQRIKSKEWHSQNKDRVTELNRKNYAQNAEKNRRRAKEYYHSLPEHIRRAKVRRESLRRKYGVTPEWYDHQLAKQGGGCAICGEHIPCGKFAQWMVVDHDHQTGKPRGILCGPCNRGVAYLDKNGWLDKAQQYLRS